MIDTHGEYVVPRVTKGVDDREKYDPTDLRSQASNIVTEAKVAHHHLENMKS